MNPLIQGILLRRSPQVAYHPFVLARGLGDCRIAGHHPCASLAEFDDGWMILHHLQTGQWYPPPKLESPTIEFTCFGDLPGSSGMFGTFRQGTEVFDIGLDSPRHQPVGGPAPHQEISRPLPGTAAIFIARPQTTARPGDIAMEHFQRCPGWVALPPHVHERRAADSRPAAQRKHYHECLLTYGSQRHRCPVTPRLQRP